MFPAPCPASVLESVCHTCSHSGSSKGIENSPPAEGACRGSGGLGLLGCRVGGSLLPRVLPPLSHPRPGDRIELVDDSNEDWWKVTWQGGERRVGGGRDITSPHPQRTQPQRPPLLPPPALARPRPTLRSYSRFAPPRHSLVPPSTLCPFQPRSHPTRGSNTEKPNLEDDSIGSEWALGLEKAVGVGGGTSVYCQPHPQGKIGDRVGFFPANFVQRVRPGENVWRCCQPFSGNKEQGYMSLKESQVRAWALHGWRGGRGREAARVWARALEEDACSLAAGGKAG